MRKIRVSDVTMKQKKTAALSFREKLEVAKLLDRLSVDVIELPFLSGKKADSLLVKSIAQSVKNAALSVSVHPEAEEVATAREALGEAVKPRLQVVCPVSSVQMEYLYHCKPAVLLEKVRECVSCCRKFCEEVEFVAEDATRSEEAFLTEMLSCAIGAGATLVTLKDESGSMLPEEFGQFFKAVAEKTEGIREGKAEIGAECSNALSMADILSLTAAASGASELKTAVACPECASLSNLVKIIKVKGETLGLECGVLTVEMDRIAETVEGISGGTKADRRIPEKRERGEGEERVFTAKDGIDEILLETRRLGYELSGEDGKNVYDTFLRTVSKKEKVTSREMEAIIASSALQVPPIYRVEDYIINTGTLISATSHMKLSRDGKILESVAIGDGAVDASFLAIEQITGHHYELDDFQIQSVTEGRTAVGETVVKLRAGGRLYSGRGISTDIIGSSIHAYINALNKIVYEEENA